MFRKSIFFTVHFGCSFFSEKPRAFCTALFFCDLIIKGWNAITIVTSLGTRVLIGTPSEISKFGLFRQFCVQEFSADLALHKQGMLYIVCHDRSGILKERFEEKIEGVQFKFANFNDFYSLAKFKLKYLLLS